jgi:hypothetical protein
VNKKTLLCNNDIETAILAVPQGHQHLRLALTDRAGETIILQEATVAAIVRAYTTIKTHPVKNAVKLVSVKPAGLKKGYAEDQLVEVVEEEKQIIAKLSELLDAASRECA